jgi:hypothetical protein
MPPRLLPFKEFGYIDTLHTGKAASIWTTNKVCLEPPPSRSDRSSSSSKTSSLPSLRFTLDTRS